MTDFNSQLRNLDADGLADIATAVAREQARRAPKKSPGEMSPAEHAAWEADLIRRADAARAAAQSEMADE